MILLPGYSRYIINRQRIKSHPYFAGLENFGHFLQRYSLYAGLILLGILVTGNNIFARTIRPDEVGQGAIWTAFVPGTEPELIVETTRNNPTQATAPSTVVGGLPASSDSQALAIAENTDPSLPTVAIGQDTFTGENDGSPGISTRTETVQYTVQNGDTISTIAQQFGVTSRTVLQANGLSATDFIKPSQVLKIPPQSGILYVVKSGDTLSKIARTYKGNQEEILTANNLATPDALQTGDEIVIPNGELPAPPASSPQTPRRGIIGGIFVRNEATPPPAATTGRARFIWPAGNHRVNQYYRGRFHTGIDIECGYGDAEYAAAAGTVTYAGSDRSGYGIHVVIDHGNGYQTLYGHASKLYVRAGQRVTQGQTISSCGSTGRSTGTHLHFEIRAGGGFLNPLSFY